MKSKQKQAAKAEAPLPVTEPAVAEALISTFDDFGLAANAVATMNQYGVFVIPHEFRKREVCRVLAKGEINEPRTLQFIRNHAGDGDVISGGSFIGDFLPAISTGLAKTAQLHSFEPNPLSHAAAAAAIKLNRLKNVNFHAVAVGEKKESLHLKVRELNGQPLGGMSTLVEGPQGDATIEVPVMPLDDLVPATRRVSILHLDVEGHEWPALLGAKRIIEKHAPILILEANKDWMSRSLYEKLQATYSKHDYHLFGTMERNAYFVAVART